MTHYIESFRRKQLHWLSRLLDSSHIGILIVDQQKKCLLSNDCLCDMFGYERAELLCHTSGNLQEESNILSLFSNFKVKEKLNEESYCFDHQVQRKDGSMFWIHAAADIIKETGEVLWTVIDITDRVAAQEETFYIKKRLEWAIEANREVVWDWDLVSKELYVTDVWKEIIGHDAEKTPYKIEIWKQHIHPDDRRAVLRDIQDNIAGRSDFIDNIHRLHHSDGHWIWIQLRGKTIFDENGKPVRTIGTHRNITREKAMEQKIARQANIIEQIHDSVISVDLKGYIQGWNKGSEVLFEYTSQEVLDQHVKMLFPNKEQYASYAQMIKQNVVSSDFCMEITLLKKSRAEVIINLSLSSLYDDEGERIGYIGFAQDITDKKRVEQEILKQKDLLHYQATHDMLTQLPNRLSFHTTLEKSIEDTRKQGSKMALLFIDLDHFKEINDSLGHDIGDEVLKEVTRKLQGILKETKMLFRLGGDEFTIIMQQVESKRDISVLAQLIIGILETPMFIGKHKLYVSCSIGISIYPDDGTDVKTLLQYADAAMYKTKVDGGSSFYFYQQKMTQKIFERMTMESRLRDAIRKEQFTVWYQPQIKIETGELIGIEALARWKDPEKGMLMPKTFIKLAESTGLIVSLDRLVMKKAISQVVKWRKEGLDPGILMLNLSVRHLEEKDFLETIDQMLLAYECKPEWVEFELTESQIMKNPQESINILNGLKDRGIRLVIDDFGTGYSSLSYLKKLPLYKLKIDQSFIKELPECKEDIAICKAIIALGKSLGLDLIAEGVETESQKDFLLACGCENIQGYYYSKPLSAKHMECFL